MSKKSSTFASDFAPRRILRLKNHEIFDRLITIDVVQEYLNFCYEAQAEQQFQVQELGK